MMLLVLGYLVYSAVGNNNLAIYPVRFPWLYKHWHNQPDSFPICIRYHCGGVCWLLCLIDCILMAQYKNVVTLEHQQFSYFSRDLSRLYMVFHAVIAHENTAQSWCGGLLKISRLISLLWMSNLANTPVQSFELHSCLTGIATAKQCCKFCLCFMCITDFIQIWF